MGKSRKRPGYPYPYPRPMVTVDLVVLAPVATGHRVLLIRRGKWPFQGDWALPGGFVEMDESLEGTARRELAEETGLILPPPTSRGRRSGPRIRMEQLHTFGRPDRDPRGRTITVAYLIVLRPNDLPAVLAGDDAADAVWFNVRRLPQLAFDHRQIVRCALDRLRVMSRR